MEIAGTVESDTTDDEYRNKRQHRLQLFNEMQIEHIQAYT